MILGFHQQFVTPILNGTKIHTIREDKYNRWEPGRIIHGATGVRTKKYHQFFQEICKSTQKIEIRHYNLLNPTIIIDERILFYFNQIVRLAQNDGFNSVNDFFNWFDTDFTGKIIHWTDFKY